jgi:hypothetical protein
MRIGSQHGHVVQVQRLGNVFRQIENVVEPIDQRVNRTPRKRRQQRAPEQRQRFIDDIVGTLFERFDLAHSAVTVANVLQQLRERGSPLGTKFGMAVEQSEKPPIAR